MLCTTALYQVGTEPLPFYPPKDYTPPFLHYPKITPFLYFSMINYIIYRHQYEIVLGLGLRLGLVLGLVLELFSCCF